MIVEGVTERLEKASYDLFGVWVGGTEVNENYLTIAEAVELAHDYIDDGYDDVHIIFDLDNFKDN